MPTAKQTGTEKRCPSSFVTKYSPTYLDKDVGFREALLVHWQVLGRLDQRLDQQGVLGDPRCDEEQALGYPLLLQQGILGALFHELLEPAVGLEELLVLVDGLLVLGAERAVRVLPQLGGVAWNLGDISVRDRLNNRG